MADKGENKGSLGEIKDLDILLEDVNKNLLNEASFKQYKALVRIRYNDDPELHLGAEKIAEMLRAIPGATRVNTVQMDKETHTIIYNVRTVSQKDARHCFMAFKQNCLDRFKGMVLGVDIGAGSIEVKNFVK